MSEVDRPDESVGRGGDRDRKGHSGRAADLGEIRKVRRHQDESFQGTELMQIDDRCQLNYAWRAHVERLKSTGENRLKNSLLFPVPNTY